VIAMKRKAEPKFPERVGMRGAGMQPQSLQPVVYVAAGIEARGSF